MEVEDGEEDNEEDESEDENFSDDNGDHVNDMSLEDGEGPDIVMDNEESIINNGIANDDHAGEANANNANAEEANDAAPAAAVVQNQANDNENASESDEQENEPEIRVQASPHVTRIRSTTSEYIPSQNFCINPLHSLPSVAYCIASIALFSSSTISLSNISRTNINTNRQLINLVLNRCMIYLNTEITNLRSKAIALIQSGAAAFGDSPVQRITPQKQSSVGHIVSTPLEKDRSFAPVFNLSTSVSPLIPSRGSSHTSPQFGETSASLILSSTVGNVSGTSPVSAPSVYVPLSWASSSSYTSHVPTTSIPPSTVVSPHVLLSLHILAFIGRRRNIIGHTYTHKPPQSTKYCLFVFC
jgi:hypothetical protein